MDSKPAWWARPAFRDHAKSAPASLRGSGSDHTGQYTAAVMQNEMVKRLMWSGLLAGLGAAASIAVHRVATLVWKRVFDEEPPE